MLPHKNELSSIFIAFAILAFCIVETLCFTYFKALSALESWNNIIYAVCGIAIGLLTMALATRPVATKVEIPKYKLLQIFGALACTIFLAVLCLNFGNSMFANAPVSHYVADMLPSIKLACNRFLAGKDVYAYPINEPGMWPNTYIPYLPAMWMPYLPAIALGVDMRWINLIALIMICAVTLYMMVRYKISYQWIVLLVVAALLFLIVKYFTWEYHILLLCTQEVVPALFYIVLFAALALNKQWLIAIALALCALSRYSLAPFIPFYFIWLYINKDYRGLIKTVLIFSTVVAVLFLFPYFLNRPTYFINLIKGYVNFEEAFWVRNLKDISPANTNLGIIQSIGYQPAILQHLKSMMLASILLWACAWLVYYYIKRKQISICKELYLLAGFKIALVLFYNLLNINYQYLYLVPTVISYPIIWAVFRKTDLSKHKTT